MLNKSLDIVLPCYNPRTDWAQNVVASMLKISRALPEVYLQLTIVNDGSSHNVSEQDFIFIREGIAPIPLQALSHSPNRGKGYTLREGILASSNELAIFTDIDFPYTEESLISLYSQLATGKGDIVPGVRDETYYKDVPPTRRFISKTLRKMLKLFLNLEITDTQCGLKGFNQKGKKIFLSTRINRFLFDMEFIYLGSNARDIQISPCEVELKPDIVFSKMNWRILLREMVNFIGILIRRKNKGRP